MVDEILESDLYDNINEFHINIVGETAQKQFFSADNMTDEVAALSVLIQNDIATTEIEKFYDKWSDDRLVIDKWFTLQSSLSQPSKALKTTKMLTKHSDFNEKNPNRFRATIGGFTQNLAAFHMKGGEGYKFVADWIRKIENVVVKTNGTEKKK